MTVHTKWEILVKKLLKLVKLFKSYGLFGEPKVRLVFFLEKCLKKRQFWTEIYFFHYLVGYHAFFYCTVSSLCFKKEVLYTPVGVL